jgi:hypothetical protein
LGTIGVFMKLTLEGELAEKKLSPEFLRWLDAQIVDCGSQVAFARAINAQKTTIYQWKQNKVGEIRPEFLEELMRYMAQLPGKRRIIAASISEVRDFVESGIMPGADLNLVENITKNTVLNWLAVSSTLEDAIDVSRACLDVVAIKTQPQDTGSERVRRFILNKLGAAGLLGLGAKEFSVGFYTTNEEVARCDRWMRGSEPIPKKSLFTLANALSARLGERISESDLLTIYSDDLVGAD